VAAPRMSVNVRILRNPSNYGKRILKKPFAFYSN
jgi:hypothetical protein